MKNPVKIMLIGSSNFSFYSTAFYNAWREMGNDVVYVKTDLFTKDLIEGNCVENIIGRFENKYTLGHRIRKLNDYILKKAAVFVPHLVFIYAANCVYAGTAKKLKQQGSKLFTYNNDNPFSEFVPKYFWRHYRGLLPYADVGFVYRTSNLEDNRRAGCSVALQLRGYYIKERNFYIESPRLKVPQVIFLGHYEKDERGDYIKGLLEEKIKVGIMKDGWEKYEAANPYVIRLENTIQDYNEMLNAADIAIVFLSKINHDTYTQRCFEIPAVKTLMVAPYTQELASMFKEDEEAVFFRNKEEFVEKIMYYLQHSQERKKIAEAGYARVMRDGHEVGDRARYVLEVYQQITERKSNICV